MDGFVNVLKPSGMSSNYAVVGVRRLLPRGVKTGHMGTLDPAAAGVLPVGVGFGARLFNYVIDKEKVYRAELTLGIETDTQDAEGRVTARRSVGVGSADILAVIPRFVGDVMQTPPAYSAIVKDGRKLYSIAREGGDASVPQRPVHIERIELKEQTGEHSYLLEITCGRGTYVRTVCADIGAALGCGGCCTFLLRRKAGCFTLENSVPLDDLRPGEVPLLPVDLPIMHMPRADAGEALRQAVRNGTPLPARRWSFESAPQEGEPLRAYLADRFVGVARLAGGVVRFEALLPASEI